MANREGKVKGASQDTIVFEETTKIIQKVSKLQEKVNSFSDDRTAVRSQLLQSIFYSLSALRASSTGEYDA